MLGVTNSFQSPSIFDVFDSLESRSSESDNNMSNDSYNFAQLEHVSNLKQEFRDDSFRTSFESENSQLSWDKTSQDLLNVDILDWMYNIDSCRRSDLPEVKCELFRQDQEEAQLHKMTRSDSISCNVTDLMKDYHLADLIDISEIDEHIRDSFNIDYEYFVDDCPMLPNISSFINPCEELLSPILFAPSKSHSPLNKDSTSDSPESPTQNNKINKAQQNSTDKKHFVKRPKKTKATHLWKFMRSLLDDPAYNPSFIRWENKEKGVFRIVPGQSKNIAKLWGIKKNNPTMTFDKLSRSLRWCREYGFLSKVPSNEGFPKKLCFRFGDRAMDWNGN